VRAFVFRTEFEKNFSHRAGSETRVVGKILLFFLQLSIDAAAVCHSERDEKLLHFLSLHQFDNKLSDKIAVQSSALAKLS